MIRKLRELCFSLLGIVVIVCLYLASVVDEFVQRLWKRKRP